MLLPVPHIPVEDERVRVGLQRLREELSVPGAFPDEVLRDADRAVAIAAGGERTDRRDIELVTVDPPGTTDLDQALDVREHGAGYRVHYAIADLGWFVRPGGPLDAETHRRALTHYAPDGRSPLHPDVIGADAASLLPERDRPALLWTVDLDGDGVTTAVRLERAMVRSRAQLSYAQAQAFLDGAPGAPGALGALATVGRLRQEQEAARGGISLEHPQQEVELRDGRPELRYAQPLPVEGFNAQISLLCGIEAARIMLDAGIGLLRTMPPAEERALQRLRRTAGAVGVVWDPATTYPEFVRSLDPGTTVGAALLTQCARTLRGAAYTPLDGTVPTVVEHAAIAAPYAHVTAPIRRLADRLANEVLLYVTAGQPVPEVLRAGLAPAAEAMIAGGRRAAALDRGAIDLVEALILSDRVGETFLATVVDADERGATVQLRDPAVQGRAKGSTATVGAEVTVRLTEADPERRLVRFEVAG